MDDLVLHPDCVAGPIARVSAAIEATESGCRARFRFEGDIEKIIVPGHANSERTDNLWQTTCCEIFWQPHGGSAYHEFNLSPSSRWACYAFDDVRLNGRDAPVPAVATACSTNGTKLNLETSIASDLPLPADVALNAIVENCDGTLQYWALAFADGKPDFHRKECRRITLEKTS